MSRFFSRALIVGGGALVLLVGPVVSGLPYLGAIEAHAASKDNGAAKGKSQKAADKPSPAKKSNSSAHNDKPQKAELVAEISAPESTKNVHAQLGGLNSLKRNINGLMNSADPRMEAVRSFVQASAQLVATQAELSNARGDLGSARDAYNGLAATLLPVAYDGDPAAYADLSIAALSLRLEALNAALALDSENTGISEEITSLSTAILTLQASPELQTLTDVQLQVDTLAALEAEGIAATDDATLVAALNGASNDGSLSDDALLWARQQLGVGDYFGLIDEYIAEQ